MKKKRKKSKKPKVPKMSKEPKISKGPKKLKKPKVPKKPKKPKKPESDKRYPFQVGDSVLVKAGVKDFDFGSDISGWQGRVSQFMETEEYGTTVMIGWDSITLLNQPESMLIECTKGGLSWDEMGLQLDEVELTTSRDTLKDVERAKFKVEKKCHSFWHWIGPEGEEITQVLRGTDPDNEMEQLEAWADYLTQKLEWPFQGEIDELTHPSAPLRIEDVVNVRKIELIDHRYGIIVEVTKRPQHVRYHCLLADLTTLDPNSPNSDSLQAYRSWFANR